MKEFWIDFQGYCLVGANTAEEAKEKFEMYGVHCAKQEPVLEIETVEEKED